MAYKYLNCSAVLEHLQEGQTVNFDTLIKFFENFKHENGTKKALITFSKNHCLQCEPVQD